MQLAFDPAEQESACNQMHDGKEVAGGLVMAGGDPAGLLELAIEPLDEVARPAGLAFKRPW